MVELWSTNSQNKYFDFFNRIKMNKELISYKVMQRDKAYKI